MGILFPHNGLQSDNPFADLVQYNYSAVQTLSDYGFMSVGRDIEIYHINVHLDLRDLQRIYMYTSNEVLRL